MLTRNYVAKHLYKANKPSVIASKKTSLLLDATLRDCEEDLASELVDKGTIAFSSGSVVHWNSSDDALQGGLDDIGCSSISITDEEDGE